MNALCALAQRPSSTYTCVCVFIDYWADYTKDNVNWQCLEPIDRTS